MEYIISISMPGKSWDLIVGHGKAICFLKTKRQKDGTKIEQITDESITTAFNFSRNGHRHAL